MPMLEGESRRATAQRVVAPDANERSLGAQGAAAPLMVNALLMEMSGVLYDATVWWRWMAALIQRLHSDLAPATLQREWITGYLNAVRCGHREFSEALESFLWAQGLSRGEIDEALAAGLSRRRDLEFEVLPFPGVKKTLARLRQRGLRMGIVADAAHTSEELSQRIDRLGLAGMFETVVSSVELGCIKPSAPGYQHAVGQLNLPAAEVAFLSTSDRDLEGAAAVGLRTIGLGGAVSCGEATIGRIEELMAALEQRELASV